MDKINALKSIWDGFDFTYLLNILLSVIPALVCITLHELSHGFVAYKLGDDTAKNAGRLTLNPIKHLDIMGLIMMVVFHFGWAKPVPVNMYKFKDPKRGMAITALAGPVSNILITIVFLFIYGLLYIPLQLSDVGQYILQMIMITAYISLGLAVFNFIPVPPLDGSKVLFSLMSQYTPQPGAVGPLARHVTRAEYRAAAAYMENCGIRDGFTQERTSAREEYTPAFDLTGV